MSNIVLFPNASIYKGDTGPAGSIGPQGPTGPQGPMGNVANPMLSNLDGAWHDIFGITNMGVKVLTVDPSNYGVSPTATAPNQMGQWNISDIALYGGFDIYWDDGSGNIDGFIQGSGGNLIFDGATGLAFQVGGATAMDFFVNTSPTRYTMRARDRMIVQGGDTNFGDLSSTSPIMQVNGPLYVVPDPTNPTNNIFDFGDLGAGVKGWRMGILGIGTEITSTDGNDVILAMINSGKWQMMNVGNLSAMTTDASDTITAYNAGNSGGSAIYANSVAGWVRLGYVGSNLAMGVMGHSHFENQNNSTPSNTCDIITSSGASIEWSAPGWWGGALSGSYGAGYFYDSTRYVYLANGAYAIQTTGDSMFQGGNTYFGNTSSYIDQYGDGTMQGGWIVNSAYGEISLGLATGNNYWSPTNAIVLNTTGGVKMTGLTSGAGLPATILTSYELYVDNLTGIVYCQ